jgi:hypothetical protein
LATSYNKHIRQPLGVGVLLSGLHVATSRQCKAIAPKKKPVTRTGHHHCLTVVSEDTLAARELHSDLHTTQGGYFRFS